MAHLSDARSRAIAGNAGEKDLILMLYQESVKTQI